MTFAVRDKLFRRALLRITNVTGFINMFFNRQLSAISSSPLYSCVVNFFVNVHDKKGHS